MVPAPRRASPGADDRQPSDPSAIAASKHSKPSTSRSRAPWPLDTFWSSAARKHSSAKSRSPASPEPPPLGATLGSSYESCPDQPFDFNDLPLTPPDSGGSAFELHPATAARQQPPPLVAAATLEQDFKPQQKPHSKNDIFNAPISWLTPPSRINPAPPSQPHTAAPPPSKNSSFFSSFGSASSPQPPLQPPPPPARLHNAPARSSSSTHAAVTSTRQLDSKPAPFAPAPTIPSPSAAKQQATGRKLGHSRNSSLGRASSEECLQEEARIRAAKHVDFRLCPTNEFLLGEGRHCSVYLGSYRPTHDPLPAASSSDSAYQASMWRLCAIKRLHADRQSQLLGLDEAFALRRLGMHPNIIQLIDIRDEVEFATAPDPSANPHASRPDVPSAGLGLGLGLPRIEGRGALSTPLGHASHARSTSDMTGKDELIFETKSHKRALAEEIERRVARDSLPDSHPAERTRVVTTEYRASDLRANPTFLVHVPDSDAQEIGANANEADQRIHTAPVRRSASTALDPPRLLILLELLPHNLALYARKHADRIDLQQWLDWAHQMVEAVAFLHDKGCVHADIKKENMLLTDGLDIKLCDFNSAVFPNPNDPPRDGLGLGTPAYCAPELSRATGGPSATSFSYPIDIFSLGAVLYSLATGAEPFSKARSVVEMLHRKRLFFESEENDRASRLAVEAGSNPNSQPASRSGSLRGRHPKSSSASINETPAGAASPAQLASSLHRILQLGSPAPRPPRREASSDSLESVASSITTIAGRHPSSLAVSRLLEPTDEPRGLLVDRSGPMRKNSLLFAKADVRRAASTGGRNATAAGSAALQRLRISRDEGVSALASPITAAGDDHAPDATDQPAVRKGAPGVARVTMLEATSRPDWLRRRSSYGDEVRAQSAHHSPSDAVAIAQVSGSELVAERADELATTPTKPSRLRTMFSPMSTAFPHLGEHDQLVVENSAHETATHLAPDDDTSAWEQHSPDLRPYADGHPAIILPAGGRLPDWARDLLRDMLHADPAARPTAHQVRSRLRSAALSYI
ncbi:hypothetical protein PaG_06207 [Moesziomyces aphidis]|uniref:Protein kinase domain-containing protein n=1 Tax=Moesziomyces aphidis TaxID=84754 RepID=W3VEE6_MOEAP|nr:hypothetical protein PaG_06207 [Moesziomyces aphidis]